MVRTHPDPPTCKTGGVAQLGERLLCKQEVIGSIPIGSTSSTPLATLQACRIFTTSLSATPWRVRTLFKNPEVLFLTLSFQAN